MEKVNITDDIVKLIYKLSDRKSPGPDGMRTPNKLNGLQVLLHPLTRHTTAQTVEAKQHDTHSRYINVKIHLPTTPNRY